MKFDENLAAVHAYLCADGYVIKNPKTQKHKYYYIGFRNTNGILLNDFQKRFNNYFNIKPRLMQGERCIVQNKEIYELLIKKFKTFYSWHWQMPKLNKELSKYWLRAYFDCEGWVTVQHHQNRMIGLDCVNFRGLRQIQRSLKVIGIETKIKKRNTRNIYSIFIYGKDNLNKFKNEIGFLHPKKNVKLNQLVNNYIVYEWILPQENEKLVEFIKKTMRNKLRIKRPNGVFRIISNRAINLTLLNKELKNMFDIESRVNKRKNGKGTIYFQLDINKKEEINKLISNNLITEELKQEWYRLKK